MPERAGAPMHNLAFAIGRELVHSCCVLSTSPGSSNELHTGPRLGDAFAALSRALVFATVSSERHWELDLVEKRLPSQTNCLQRSVSPGWISNFAEDPEKTLGGRTAELTK